MSSVLAAAAEGAHRLTEQLYRHTGLEVAWEEYTRILGSTAKAFRNVSDGFFTACIHKESIILYLVTWSCCEVEQSFCHFLQK
jgi:hypothetical protein